MKKKLVGILLLLSLLCTAACGKVQKPEDTTAITSASTTSDTATTETTTTSIYDEIADPSFEGVHKFVLFHEICFVR